MDSDPPTFRSIAREFSTKGYAKRARERAKRRKSPWNFLLLPLSMGGIGGCAYGFGLLFWSFHVFLHPEHAGQWNELLSDRGPSSAGKLLMTVPCLFAAIPLGLIAANAMVWLIPPARRVLNQEANGVKWASFRDSMRALWIFAKVLVPAALVLGLLGAVLLP